MKKDDSKLRQLVSHLCKFRDFQFSSENDCALHLKTDKSIISSTVIGLVIECGFTFYVCQSFDGCLQLCIYKSESL